MTKSKINFFYFPLILGGLILSISVILPWYNRTLPNYCEVSENGLGWILNGVGYSKADFGPHEWNDFLPIIAVSLLPLALVFNYFHRYIFSLVLYIVGGGFLFLVIKSGDWGPVQFNLLFALGVVLVILGIIGLKRNYFVLTTMTLYTGLFSICFLYLIHYQASSDYLPRYDNLGNEIIKGSSLNMIGVATAWIGATLILVGSFLPLIAYLSQYRNKTQKYKRVKYE
jgi:hypothetical protein